MGPGSAGSAWAGGAGRGGEEGEGGGVEEEEGGGGRGREDGAGEKGPPLWGSANEGEKASDWSRIQNTAF